MHDPVETAIQFIECINRRKFSRMFELMSPDHCSDDEEGNTIVGPEAAKNKISDYTSTYPDFQIHINNVYVKDNTVWIIGRTTGSCAGISRTDEIRERFIYMLHVEGGLVTRFQYALEDTDALRSKLGIHSAENALGIGF